MKRRLVLVFAGLVAGAGALLVIDACTIVNGLVVDIGDGSAMTATPDGGGEGSVDAAPDPCGMHANPPAKPPVNPKEVPGSEVFTIVATAADFGLGDGGAFEAISFDLDKVCTCIPTVALGPSSCKPYVGDDPMQLMHCDDPGGADNGAQKLLNTAKQSKLDFAKQSNDSVGAGGRSVLVQVADYNGELDDTDVKVSVLVSPGLFDGSGDPMTPTFTAADKWSVDSQATTKSPGGVLPIDRQQGYVAGGILVATPGAISLPISQVAVLTMTNPIFFGKVVKDPTGGGHTLTDIRIAGRWSVDSAIRVVGSFEPFVGAGKFCETPALDETYKSLKKEICKAADLRAAPGDDNMMLDCNAVSVAVKVQGKPASIGEQKDIVTVEPCPDASVVCP